jgi:type 1 fimbria pilin
MATQPKTITALTRFGEDCHLVVWTGLLNTDDGDPFEGPGSNERSIQFTGTFGSGGTIVLEGSNNGTHWFTLTDPQGNNISATTARIKRISELTRYVRPRVTAGDGSTNLTATMLVRRAYGF